jgi:hypothetical protein
MGSNDSIAKTSSVGWVGWRHRTWIKIGRERRKPEDLSYGGHSSLGGIDRLSRFSTSFGKLFAAKP